MAAKYKEYFERMLTLNEPLFVEFREIHGKYELDPEETQEEFNEIGHKIQRVLRATEDKLCMQTMKGGYGSYANNLSEKFQEETRRQFPHVDKIGIVVFKINKISL